MINPNVIKKEDSLPGDTGTTIQTIATGKDLEADLHVPKTIPLGQVNVDGKPVEFTLGLYTLGRAEDPALYFLYADGNNVDFYSKQDNREILEGGNGVHSKEDIDIDGNTIYMRNGPKYWLKYIIEKKRDDKIGLVLQERIVYNPLKPTTKTKIVGKNKNMTLVEYRNPPQRGHIDPNFFKPTEGKLLLIHDRGTPGRNKVLNFPQKEGVVFDENTANVSEYTLYIQDIHGKQYKYEINVVNPDLRELDIRY